MSRYIDADAMKEWLDEYLSVFKKYDKSEVKGFVEHQPSIDIVRCKECKYWTNNEMQFDNNLVIAPCKQWLQYTRMNGYCHNGERSSE